jgi:RNA polymerase sigma factor (sigma-70 family)
LLARFVGSDGAAFAALLHRHSGMVMSVCRRVLDSEEDVEDAAQATFLVLARRASSIRKADSLVSWLHGVALKVAADMRRGALRQACAKPAAEAGGDDPAAVVSWREVMQVLDEELHRLPAAYRAPLVLVYLEGQPMDVGASQLGWTMGSFRGRLERGRELLRKRLTRRGVTLPAALFGAGLSAADAAAGLTVAKAASTVQAAVPIAGGRTAAAGLVSAAAAALSERVVTTMAIAKLKTVLVLAITLGVLCATGLFLADSIAGQTGDTQKKSIKADGRPKAQSKDDKQLLQGEWAFVSGEARGRPIPAEFLKDCCMTFKGDKFRMQMVESKEGTFRLDPAASPRTIDLNIDGGTGLGIYALEGDTLKLCLSEKDKDNRPTKFSSKDAATKQVYFVPKRKKPGETGKKAKGSKVSDGTLKKQILELQQKVKALEATAKQREILKGRLEDALRNERESLTGTLTKIDIEKNAVSILLRNAKIVVEAIPLSSGVKFYLNDKACSINDLKAGMQARLKFETDDGKARVTGVYGRKESAKKDGPESTAKDKETSKARSATNPQLRRAWLDLEGRVPTDNDIAVAALCWAVKEQMRDRPFAPWLGGKPVQVDWPLDTRFARFAALDLCGVLPGQVTDSHLRRDWLDLYGLPLTGRDKEDAARKWIRFRQKKAKERDESV